VPFKAAHLDLMAWRDFDATYTRTLPNFEAQVEADCEGSLAVTIIQDGRILACGGILPIGDGLGYCWLFGSTYLHLARMWFFRETLKWLHGMFETLSLHRLQTVCHVDDTQGIKWVEALGFIAEGTLKSYDAKQGDYVMYAITKTKDKEEA
jgi:RimJ/RimL family protein N-acetyltransferase